MFPKTRFDLDFTGFHGAVFWIQADLYWVFSMCPASTKPLLYGDLMPVLPCANKACQRPKTNENSEGLSCVTKTGWLAWFQDAMGCPDHTAIWPE